MQDAKCCAGHDCMTTKHTMVCRIACNPVAEVTARKWYLSLLESRQKDKVCNSQRHLLGATRPIASQQRHMLHHQHQLRTLQLGQRACRHMRSCRTSQRRHNPGNNSSRTSHACSSAAAWAAGGMAGSTNVGPNLLRCEPPGIMRHHTMACFSTGVSIGSVTE